MKKSAKMVGFMSQAMFVLRGLNHQQHYSSEMPTDCLDFVVKKGSQ